MRKGGMRKGKKNTDDGDKKKKKKKKKKNTKIVMDVVLLRYSYPSFIARAVLALLCVVFDRI